MPHRTTFKVRFSDLDPYDHVNHAEYLRYFEAARIELLEEIGFGMDAMKEAGVQIVLVELTAHYLAPATLHDVLTVSTEVVEVRRTASRWHQEAHCDGRAVATLDVHAAFTDRAGRPCRAPDGFAAAAFASAAGSSDR